MTDPAREPDPATVRARLGDLDALEGRFQSWAERFAESLVRRLIADRDALFGLPRPPVIAPEVRAWRWRVNAGRGMLEAVHHIHAIRVDDLVGIERQIARVDANTRQFVRGHPCNNVLMWGARGTGKSSLVKAMLNRYANDGLRLVEIDAHDLIDLPHVVAPLLDRPERFILFVDDLSFDSGDPSYRTLKAALDGSVAVAPDNVVIYATSNRRHLLPETAVDNEQVRLVDGELHHGEAVEEKISLSERFGVWLAFHPFSQSQYLEAVDHWLAVYGIRGLNEEAAEQCRQQALRWALLRGNRSGRIAWQFAMDYAGRQAIGSGEV